MSGTAGPARLGIAITLQNQQALAGFQQLREAVSRLTRDITPLEQQLRSVDRILTYMATASMVALTAQFIRMSAEMERMQLLLFGLEGSFDKANQRMDQLVAIASRAPFSLQAITDAFVKLKAAGIEPITGADGRSGPLQALIDGLAAFGGSEQQLQRATIALQQMAGKGVISLEELRQQLGEAIPTAMQLMAEGLGMTVSRLISEISKGNIEAGRGIEALMRMLREKYGGAADLLSNSMSGAFNQLRTQINRISLEMQRAGFFDVIIVGLRQATAALERFGDAVRDNGTGVLQSFFLWIDRNAETIARFVSTVGQFGLAIGLILTAIGEALSALPAEVVAGGLLGFILFGKTGAVVGALLGSVDGFVVGLAAMFSSLISMISGLASILGLEVGQFAAIGLVGAILFGRTGFIVGGLALLADTMIGNLRRRLSEFAGWAVGVYTAISKVFEGDFTGSLAAGRTAREEFMRNNTGTGTFFGDTTTTPFGELFRGGAEAARVNTEQVRAFNSSMQDSIRVLREARQAFEGRFGTPNAPTGLNQQEIDQVRDITSAYERMGDRLRSLQGREIDGFLAARQRELERLRGIIGAVTERANTAEREGRTEQAAQLRAEVRSLTEQATAFQNVMDRIRQADSARVGEQAGRMVGRYANQLQQIRQQLEAAQAEFNNGRDSENAEVERMEARFAPVIRALANLRAQTEALRGSEQERATTLAQIIELQAFANRLVDQGTEFARRKAAREREDAQREANRAVEEANTSLRREQLSRSQNPFAQRDLEVLERAERYRNQITQLDDRLLELRRRMEDQGTNPDPWIQQQIDGLQRVRDAYQQFYDMVGSFQEEEAIRARELWEGVSDSVKDSLGQTLEMLITRTGNFKDIANDLFRSISRSVANYLGNLAFSQLGGMLGGAFGGGGGGSFDLGKLGGIILGGVAQGGVKSANGNVFLNGMVQRFANGAAFSNSVVAGPTLFNIGEMGEQGPEGIMPLAKVGGKLGVHARGGGDQFHISIQAVDSDSVRALFAREGGALVSALQSRMRLNRGMK